MQPCHDMEFHKDPPPPPPKNGIGNTPRSNPNTLSFHHGVTLPPYQVLQAITISQTHIQVGVHTTGNELRTLIKH